MLKKKEKKKNVSTRLEHQILDILNGGSSFLVLKVTYTHCDLFWPVLDVHCLQWKMCIITVVELLRKLILTNFMEKQKTSCCFQKTKTASVLIIHAKFILRLIGCE